MRLLSSNIASHIAFSYLKNFIKPLLMLTALLVSGSLGYRIIEKWTPLESIYMTLITLTTVGFGEVHPLSETGRIFTMALVMSGVLFYGFTVNSIFQVFMEHRFTDFVTKERMKHHIKKLNNHYIICGGGRMALAMGLELDKSGKEFVFIEKDPGAIIMDHKDRWPVIEKDALLEDTLIEARIEHAKGFASVLTTDADNLFAVLSARNLNPKLLIQTRIASETTRSKMMQAGANLVVSPHKIGGMQIARHFINPEVESFLSVVLDKAGYEFEMKTHMIVSGDGYIGKQIKETDFRENGFIVISLRYPDGTFIFAPKAHICLQEGMEVFLFGPGTISKKK